MMNAANALDSHTNPDPPWCGVNAISSGIVAATVTDASDTYPLQIVIANQSNAPIKTANGANAKSAPAPVAMPLPPLNPTQKLNM